MKLIYVANVKLPTTKAHGVQTIRMCQAFKSLGIDIELIVPKRKNIIKEDIFNYYSVKEKFKIKKLFSIDLISVKFIGRFAVHLQALSFALSVFFYVLCNPNYFNKDDIFYFRDEFSPWFLSLLNKNIYIEFHGFDMRFKFYKIFFSKINGLILVTKKAKERFINIGIKEKKILISPDGVDLSIFNINMSKEEARQKFNLPQNKKIIVYTGKFKTMGMDKGIHDILRSLRMLDEKVVFVAAGGSNNDINYYKNKAKELNALDRTIFVGHVNQNILAIYQKAADALLMPFPFSEHYAYYMSPLKMFEYMASKRPIIATDLPSIREILSENNAIIVKPDNPENLAWGIKKSLVDENLVNKITEQAFKDAHEYTWERRVERILGFIKQK